MNDLEFLLVGSSAEHRALAKVLQHKTKSSTELREWLSDRHSERKFLFVSGVSGYRCVRELLRGSVRLHYPDCRVMTLTATTAPLLDGVLSRAFGSWLPRPSSLLPWKDLSEALRTPHARDLCIGGEVVPSTGLITLLRGDFSLLVVPLSTFSASADATAPDFDDFSVADHGQTLKFGKYEAAFDAVLYEHDSEFRRREKKQRLQSERTFGASLRRLRLQRGLSRRDFPGIDAKTIARIERGEVENPHASTRAILAKKLRVRPDQLAEY